MSEWNNKATALNIFYVSYNTEEIRPAYVSEHNSNRRDQVILLMITDNKTWHYLAVKNYRDCFVK